MLIPNNLFFLWMTACVSIRMELPSKQLMAIYWCIYMKITDWFTLEFEKKKLRAFFPNPVYKWFFYDYKE